MLVAGIGKLDLMKLPVFRYCERIRSYGMTLVTVKMCQRLVDWCLSAESKWRTQEPVL